MTKQLPEPTWGTEEITRDSTIPGTWRTHVVNDETFVEITDDRPLEQVAAEGPPEAMRQMMLAEIATHDGLTRPLTPVDIVVSEEAVDAAKLHVEASRSAGVEPDPVVALMAQAQDLPEDMETWAKDQAIEAALSSTDQQAALMTAEGGLTDQTGEHDTADPLKAIEQLWDLQRRDLLPTQALPAFREPTTADEKNIVEHAMAILPHIGAEATVAYLTGALARTNA
jgi:hypothetical protein